MIIRRVGNLFKWNPRLQTGMAIERQLRLNSLEAGSLTLSRLRRLPTAYFTNILDLVKLLRSHGFVVRRLMIASPENLPDLNYQKIPLNVLLDCLDDQVLDLRQVEKELLKHQVRRRSGSHPTITPLALPGEDNQVLRLINVIAEESRLFSRVADKPQATADKIFRALNHGKAKLGFRQVTVIRAPGAALNEVMESRELVVHQGKGTAAEALYIKLISKHGLEAVVKLENEGQPLLPQDEALANGVVTELTIYFYEVVKALEKVKDRELAADPSRQLAVRRKSYRYLPSSDLFFLRRTDPEGNKHELSLELIRQPFSAFPADQGKEIVGDLYRTFADAWEPVVGKQLDRPFYQQYINDKYWGRAEKLAVLRNEEHEVVGFASMTRETINGQPVFYLAGTVMDPSVQGLRLSVKLNKMMIVEAWRQNAHHNSGRITVATRTANPRALGALTSSLDNVFPNPYDRQRRPDPARQELIAQLAQRAAPGIEFEAGKQVLRGALTKGVGGLLYQQDDIQLYRDERVNRLCDQELDYRAGDLFLFSGQVGRWTIIKNSFKELSRGLGGWWRGLWLQAFRALSR